MKPILNSKLFGSSVTVEGCIVLPNKLLISATKYDLSAVHKVSFSSVQPAAITSLVVIGIEPLFVNSTVA